MKTIQFQIAFDRGFACVHSPPNICFPNNTNNNTTASNKFTLPKLHLWQRPTLKIKTPFFAL